MKNLSFLLFFCLISPVGVVASNLENISVIRLQIYLKSVGLEVGNLDGLYGRKTDQALKDLLSEYDAEWDGELDQNDLKIIEKAVRKSPYLFEPSDKNRFLFELQEELVIGGFLEQGFTGIFDMKTRRAVDNFIALQSNAGGKYLRDGLPTFSLLQAVKNANRYSPVNSQSFKNGKINVSNNSNSSSKTKHHKKTFLKPLSLDKIRKRRFTDVGVNCEGTASGDIVSNNGRNYIKGNFRLANTAVTSFRLDENSFNNCGERIADKSKKDWEKSKARAELYFHGIDARTGYTYVFDAEFMYDRKFSSKNISREVNDRTLILQIRADPNPGCGSILDLKIQGQKSNPRLQINSTYIEIDEQFSYAKNSGGQITCHHWDSQFVSIPFPENKFHQIRVELAVLDFNHYRMHIFVNNVHAKTINYDYKSFLHKVHTVNGFFVPFGLYQMPNKFRTSGENVITAQYRNVGFYEVKSPDQ